MHLPGDAPELPWEQGPRLLTPVTGAIGALGAYAVAAWLTYRGLGDFPPARARTVLLLFAPVAFVAGGLVGAIGPAGRRGKAAALTIATSIALPFAMAAWVPGISQAQQHPLPGGIDVVIAAGPHGNPDLYLVPDGVPDRLVQLTETRERSELFPELSPDGRSVVYAVDAPDGTWDLHLLGIGDDGRPGDSRLLLDGPGDLSETSWSPDGRVLLVRSDEGGAVTLHRYVVATGRLRRFAADAANPAWSPDGTAVAFTGVSAGADTDIVVVDARGEARRAVIGTGSDDLFPIWSPRGDRIAFSGRGTGGDLDVFVVGLDGSGLRPLTSGSSANEEPYLWGPGGDILFLSDRSETGGVFVYLMEPDGSDVRLFLRL